MLNLVLLISCCLLVVDLQADHPSLKSLQYAAEKGDPWAQLNLGAAYETGMRK